MAVANHLQLLLDACCNTAQISCSYSLLYLQNLIVVTIDSFFGVLCLNWFTDQYWKEAPFDGWNSSLVWQCPGRHPSLKNSRKTLEWTQGQLMEQAVILIHNAIINNRHS
jgi:hypothetical protein